MYVVNYDDRKSPSPTSSQIKEKWRGLCDDHRLHHLFVPLHHVHIEARIYISMFLKKKLTLAGVFRKWTGRI